MADPEPRSSPVRGRPSVSWPALIPLVVASLALGGVTVETTWAVALAVLAAAAWSAVRGDLVATPLALSLGALALFTALQSLPLPLSWLATLAQASHAVWAELAALSGRERWGSISLDPGATRLEAVRLGAHALFALTCHGAVRRVGSRAACAVVAGVGAALALATVLHQLMAAERVFGWYRPLYAGFVAPLMNPNALSGALCLGFFCAAGLVLDRRTEERARWLALGAGLLTFATALWLGSRAGVVLLILGALALIGRAAARRAPEAKSARGGVLALATVLLLGTGFALFSLARLHRELFDDSLEKLTIVEPALAAARQHFLLGAGRGAFSAAVAPFFEKATGVFDHAEIFVLGWAVEWGWPVTTRFAAYLGVGVVLAHNLADLSLDVPLVAMLAIVTAVAFAGPDVGLRIAPRGAAGLGTVVAIAAVGGLLASTWFVPVELARTARHRLAEEASRGPLATARIDEALAAHPADGYIVRLRAAAALARREPNTLRAIGWALERTPGDGATLLLLADALAHQGRVEQALAALRQTLTASPGLAPEVARRASSWTPGDLEPVIAEGSGRLAALLALAPHVPEPRTRLELLARAVALPGAPEHARVELVRLALGASDADCLELFGVTCASFARTERAALGAASEPELLQIDAALLWHAGLREQAFELLRQKCPRSAEGVPCAQVLLGYGRALDLDRLVSAGDVLLSAACGSVDGCVLAELQVGDALLSRSERRLGLVHLLRAAKQRPSEALWHRVALVARDSGEVAVLEQAMAGLTSLGADVPAEYGEALDRLRRNELLPP